MGCLCWDKPTSEKRVRRGLQLILLSLLCLILSACGHCHQVDEGRRAFLSKQHAVRTDGRPQMRIEVPVGLVQAWLNEMVGQLPTVSHRLQGLGQLEQYLDPLVFDPRKLRLQATKTRIKFDLDVDVRLRDRVLFGLSLSAHAPVNYSSRRGVLEVRLDEKRFGEFEPKLTANAVPNLTRSLKTVLPAVVRPLFPRAQVEALVRNALENLNTEVVSILHSDVLKPLATRTVLRFEVPNLPMEKAVLEADRSQYTIEIWSTIPSPGLPPKGRRPTKQKVRISIASPALPVLANWAMERGFIPHRFDVQGRPDPQGLYTAGLTRRPGPNPLHVELWALVQGQDHGGCHALRATGWPKARLAKGGLALRFEEAQLESVIGLSTMDDPLSALRVADGAFEWTQKVVLNTRLFVGRSVQLQRIATLKLDEKALTYEFFVKLRKKNKGKG